MSDLSQPPLPLPDASARAIAYHERTKHTLERYARGPETLDWSAQPKPFREFAGCQRTLLPLCADLLETPYATLSHISAVIARHALSVTHLSILLEVSLGLAAWKSWGPDRWAVRYNPSSGNLHPTEAYLISCGIEGMADGVHHYLPSNHSLELRCEFAAAATVPPGLWLALSSVVWREAWKYGERAFRYCQLDAGHALAALRYAAAALGWRLEIMDSSSDDIAALVGLKRELDFSGVETEEPELLVRITPVDVQPAEPAQELAALIHATKMGRWRGKAALLDPYPMYHWPCIDDVALATRRMAGDKNQAAPPASSVAMPALAARTTKSAIEIFRQRRSAQQFDRKAILPLTDFLRLLDSTLTGRPLLDAPHLHLLLFVHRVQDLLPGIYVLPRSVEGAAALRSELLTKFSWKRVTDAPPHLPLYQLLTGTVEHQIRSICCHQAIASDSAFTVAMLAEFEEPVQTLAWNYRKLHHEAGSLGHLLYLEAETIGQRGTGIGCFLDDELHKLAGLKSQRFQSLYHFTIGTPLLDTRIETHAAYASRAGETL